MGVERGKDTLYTDGTSDRRCCDRNHQSNSASVWRRILEARLLWSTVFHGFVHCFFLRFVFCPLMTNEFLSQYKLHTGHAPSLLPYPCLLSHTQKYTLTCITLPYMSAFPDWGGAPRRKLPEEGNRLQQNCKSGLDLTFQWRRKTTTYCNIYYSQHSREKCLQQLMRCETPIKQSINNLRSFF